MFYVTSATDDPEVKSCERYLIVPLIAIMIFSDFRLARPEDMFRTKLSMSPLDTLVKLSVMWVLPEISSSNNFLISLLQSGMDSNIDNATSIAQAYPAMVVSPLILSLTKLEVFLATEVRLAKLWVPGIKRLAHRVKLVQL